jgi:peptide/nickel transport system substrate-binding protein
VTWLPPLDDGPRRRTRLLVFALVLLALAVADRSAAPPGGSVAGERGDGLAALAEPGAPQPGGILRLGNRGDPPAAWDPMRTSSIALHHVAGAVFGPGNLVQRCRENMYMVCPYLATSWTPNQDFTEWTFSLRPGVSWHDGAPFTADDVVFWFELAAFGVTVDGRTRAPAYFRANLGEIVAVEALRDQVRVTLARPTVRFPEMLLDPRMKIAHPAHLMRPRIEAGDVGVSPLDVGLVGLGPFRVVRNDPGSQVQVRRFEGYWERDERGARLPYLDGIDYLVTPDPVAMDLAIRTGRLDGGARGEGHYLSAERQEVYRRSLGDDVVLARIGGGTFRLAFNVLREGPWQDVRVRRAIALWIDGEAAIVTALGGQGYLGPLEWPGRRYDPNPFMLWPRHAPDRLPLDRREAQRLLAEAGYGDGFVMGHLCRTLHVIRCEFLQEQLRGLGVTLALEMVDEGEWNRARLGSGHDSGPGANFSGTVPEATEAVYGRYSLNPDAYAKHEDEGVDALYRRLRGAGDVPQRVATWRELERYLVTEQAYLVPIAMTVQVVPYRSYVRGLVIPPEDGHTHTDFATVWLDPAGLAGRR